MFSPRLGMAEYGGASVSEQGARRETGASGFLHILLHQLYAYTARPASAREEALRRRYEMAWASKRESAKASWF